MKTKKKSTPKKGKKATLRKDIYGNILYPGEYYYESKNSYEYKYKDIFGKTSTKTATSLDELRKLEVILQAEKDNKITSRSKITTVSDLIRVYLNGKKTIEKTTLTGYWGNYERYIVDSWFGHMNFADVLKIHVANFYNELIEEKNLSKNTICLINNFISPSFRLAIDSRWINYNPCTLVMRDVIETEQKEKIALSKRQQKVFLDHTRRLFTGYYNLINCTVYFGLRIGECLGMTEDELNFETKRLDLKHQLIYKKLHGEPKTRFIIHKPKTKNGIRYLYFKDPEIERCLNEQIEYAQYVRDIVGDVEIDGCRNFLFVTSTGKPMTPNSVNRLLDRIVGSYNKIELAKAIKENRAAELLPHLSAHSLRHTGLTRMAESGISPQTLQFIAGHSNINITLQYYVHATNDGIEEDMEKYAARWNCTVMEKADEDA